MTNVAPTVGIAQDGATDINGTPVLISRAGDAVAIAGRATDPGSDDLTLWWNWDDGGPAIDLTTTYLVNPPGLDPDPSPTVQPRDVTDDVSHAFGQACTYDVVFSASDDDGGSDSDAIKVLITGDADDGEPSGYWAHQYRGRGAIAFDAVTLGCYLEIAGLREQGVPRGCATSRRSRRRRRSCSARARPSRSSISSTATCSRPG